MAAGSGTPRGQPEDVRVHDFKDESLGKVVPYGVHDILNNQCWVSVGIDRDTAQFAGNSIRRWWNQMGSPRFPRARELLIAADGGGSNGFRSSLWKMSLQGLADDLGLRLLVCHFPPGTSKWNKIEHRLFSFVTQNWRGRPLATRQAIVNLIARHPLALDSWSRLPSTPLATVCLVLAPPGHSGANGGSSPPGPCCG